MIRALILLLLFVSPAHAWNALGHKVIADIAWQQLDEPTRAEIVKTLRRHPRFDDDFAKQGDIGDDRWIFQHAATWPDIARGSKLDMPTWHYVNHPLFVGGERPVTFNLATEPRGSASTWNVAQAIAYCRKMIASDAPPSQKALAYSWLFHLVGDLHQPMHSTALVCERFPDGDRGGNSILVQSDNLHALWDNLLGRQHKPNDVKREVAELKARPELWKVEQGDVDAWIKESHELAKFAYCPEILKAVQEPGELAKLRLPASYLKTSGEHARHRVVAAGLRLGVLLGGSAEPVAAEPVSEFEFAARKPKPTPRAMSLTPSKPATSELTHWLNTNGNVRHYSSCRWYHNTKNGRACGAGEGRACGQCGG